MITNTITSVDIALRLYSKIHIFNSPPHITLRPILKKNTFTQLCFAFENITITQNIFIRDMEHHRDILSRAAEAIRDFNKIIWEFKVVQAQ